MNSEKGKLTVADWKIQIWISKTFKWRHTKMDLYSKRCWSSLVWSKTPIQTVLSHSMQKSSTVSSPNAHPKMFIFMGTLFTILRPLWSFGVWTRKNVPESNGRRANTLTNAWQTTKIKLLQELNLKKVCLKFKYWWSMDLHVWWK